MENIVSSINGKAVVTSKDVADRFGKSHRHVMRDILDLINKLPPDFGASNFGHSKYISLQNKELNCYTMTRDGFTLLAMGFNGNSALEWKVKYIDAFNKMESMLSGDLSVMKQFDKAVKLMQEDKMIASDCGRGLQKWKSIKKGHIENLEDLKCRVQLLLNF